MFGLRRKIDLTPAERNMELELRRTAEGNVPGSANGRQVEAKKRYITFYLTLEKQRKEVGDLSGRVERYMQDLGLRR